MCGELFSAEKSVNVSFFVKNCSYPQMYSPVEKVIYLSPHQKKTIILPAEG